MVETISPGSAEKLAFPLATGSDEASKAHLCADVQGFVEEKCQALEKAYRDELRSMQEAHARELRSLKDALQLQGIVSEAAGPTRTPSDSAGEPCSEPSMQSRSSRAGSSSAGFGDDERTCTQMLGSYDGAAAADAEILQADCWPASASSSRGLKRWSHAEPAFECQDANVEGSKAERVLAQLKHALGRGSEDSALARSCQSLQSELVDVQPFESVEAYVGQLCAMRATIEPRNRSMSIDLLLQTASSHSDSLRIRRDVAKVLLEFASKDPGMKEEIIAKRSIELAVDTLHMLLSLFPVSFGVRQQPFASSSAGDVCSANFRLLAALCQRHRGQSTARAALDAVLRCLAVQQLCDSDTPVNGCYLIMTLVDKRPEHQELVRARDGIRLLLKLLDEEVIALEKESQRRCPDETRVVEQASATLCYYIAGCLAKVVQDNEKNQQALYEVGGISVLLRTLRTCMQSGQVVGNVCMAIAFVANRHELSQHAARSEGAIQLILDASLAYRGDGSVQIGVCRAIATLTEKNAANQQAFLTARLPDGDLETGVLSLLLQRWKTAVRSHW
jgi:hypothetical protein